MVHPNSGDIFPIVAPSGTDRFLKPSPKTSTNFPTTPNFLSKSAIVKTRKFAKELEPDHFRHNKIEWLPQNSCFRFDTANTPSHHANSIYHWSMAIRSH